MKQVKGKDKAGMKIIWNRELKKIVLAAAAAFLFSSFLVNFLVGKYVADARTEYNEMLAALFGSVMQAYPDVKEEEVIEVLNETGNGNRGADILARYGVYEDYGASSFAEKEGQFLFVTVWANGILILVYLLIGVLFFLYLGKRQQEIAHLTEYMIALNRDRYELEMENNEDDELSGLRNELYKLTVLLKEQTQEALEQRQALADTMVNISHQLKTPLTSVTVLADNLSDNPDMDRETRQHFLAEITRQITGMSWLITAMLKRARLDADVVELENTRLGVKELVEEVIERLELATEWKNLTISVNISEDTQFMADRKWMSEALMNIVKNALEHSPVGGRVEITGEENEIYTQIFIRDYGKGITEEERKKLFQRFYNGSSVREDSVGIGLALAKEIVEKEGGSIFVDSSPNRGTTFTLRFMKC